MLEYYLPTVPKLERARSGPVGPYIDGFAAALREAGYTERTGDSVIIYAMHLGVWAVSEGLAAANWDESTLKAFEAHLSKCECPGFRAGCHSRGAARARVFVEHLRTRGVVPPPAEQVAEMPELVTGFCEWMRRHRGSTDATLRYFQRVAIKLVVHLGEEPARYDAVSLRAAVSEVTSGHGIATAKQIVTVGRAFVRYLAVEGRCRPGLDAAILPGPRWRLASLPRYVPSEVVQRIVAAGGSSCRSGARDRAILLLLARLALRAGDIVGMRLSDIDWKDAHVSVAGKGRQQVRLPLPQEVGDAILAYLDGKRPAVTSDRLFLTARAPWGPLADGTTVSRIVRRAIMRAGVTTPTHGAHLLRHSAATAMLREGISLPTIGAVLRHRSLETTAHYAKVDVELLRSVAQPWIGGTPC